MRKIFVLDTSVMLYDKTSIHTFTGNDIVLPLVILEELDKFKERTGLIGEAARYVNRFLDGMRSKEVKDGWRLDEETDIRYTFELAPDMYQSLPEGLDIGYNDNHIIACAIYLKDKYENQEVKVITKDINLRVKCDAVGVSAEDYFKDHIDQDINSIKGYVKIETTKEEIDEFFQEGEIESEGELSENLFVLATAGPQKSFLGVHKTGNIKKLVHKIDGLFHVEPRNSEQRFAIEALLDPKIPLVTLTGLAGSGKTFLALMAGLHGLKGHQTQMGKQITEAMGHPFGYERLIITRTLQPVGRDLGYLPGSMEDKMQPWLMPIFDNVRHAFKDVSYFKMMMDQGEVEVAPIPYIRGRTFNKAFVIVDEAQNATIHELKTIITRMGQGSKIVLLGDIDQIDTPYIDRQSNGLSIVIDKFQKSKLGAHVNLSKGQRSGLATAASEIL